MLKDKWRPAVSVHLSQAAVCWIRGCVFHISAVRCCSVSTQLLHRPPRHQG